MGCIPSKQTIQKDDTQLIDTNDISSSSIDIKPDTCKNLGELDITQPVNYISEDAFFELLDSL